MSIITPKETIQKTYRLELTQADDLEMLAKAVGRTQNELIVTAVTELLFQNRSYFLENIVKEEIFTKVEKEVKVRRNEYHQVIGNVALDLNRKPEDDEDRCYFYHFQVRNDNDRIIFSEKGEVDVMSQESFQEFLDHVLVWMKTYVDMDNDEIALYFKNYFLGRS